MILWVSFAFQARAVLKTRMRLNVYNVLAFIYVVVHCTMVLRLSAAVNTIPLEKFAAFVSTLDQGNSRACECCAIVNVPRALKGSHDVVWYTNENWLHAMGHKEYKL